MISGFYDSDYSHMNNLEVCKCSCHGPLLPFRHECCGEYTNTEGLTYWYAKPVCIPQKDY